MWKWQSWTFNLQATKVTGAKVSSRDRVRVELLPLSIRRHQLRESQATHWGGVSWHVQPGGDTVADLWHAREIKSLGWPWSSFLNPLEMLLEVAGEMSAWASSLNQSEIIHHSDAAALMSQTQINWVDEEKKKKIHWCTQRCPVRYLMCIYFSVAFWSCGFSFHNMTWAKQLLTSFTFSFQPIMPCCTFSWRSYQMAHKTPLALVKWSVKYSSINHLWLLKELDFWPPETDGLYLTVRKTVWIRGEGKTVFYFPITNQIDLISPCLLFFPIMKHPTKHKSDVEIKEGRRSWQDEKQYNP